MHSQILQEAKWEISTRAAENICLINECEIVSQITLRLHGCTSSSSPASGVVLQAYADR